MIRLGITGGIGSGKSLVCSILQALSYPVYDCDRRAKALYNDNPQLKQAMIARFGLELYDTPGRTLNRTLLAHLIFNDANLLAEVNALVHPLVRADIDTWLSEQQTAGHRLAVIESAILFASKELLARTDYSIAVLAPENLRIQRAIARDNSLREEVVRRIKAQMTDVQLAKQADFTINNDGVEHLLPQIDRILRKLLSN